MKDKGVSKLVILVVLALVVVHSGCGGGGDSPIAPACTANGNIELQNFGGNPLTSLSFRAIQGAPLPAEQAVFVVYNPAAGVAAVAGGYPPTGTNPMNYGMGIYQFGANQDNPLEFRITITSTALSPNTYNAVWRFVIVDINGGILGCQDLPVAYTIDP